MGITRETRVSTSINNMRFSFCLGRETFEYLDTLFNVIYHLSFSSLIISNKI